LNKSLIGNSQASVKRSLECANAFYLEFVYFGIKLNYGKQYVIKEEPL